MDTKIPQGSIVVAVDGSDHAEAALAWGAEQAALERRHLVVASAGDVGNTYAIGWAGTEESVAEVSRRLVAHAQEIADEAADRARTLHPELTVEAVAVAGDPRHALKDLAEEAHLLVVGSRGRGPLRSALLGSVSANLAKYAACPLVVCRPGGRGTQHEQGVVVGADGSPESVPVIGFAFRQASIRGSSLTVVHSYWDAVAAVAGYRGAAELPEGPDVEELRRVMAESVAGFSEQYPDVPVQVRISHGLVDAALSPRGRAWDLVVVGRHPMNSVGRFLTGSIATAVLERSHSHVAVVPQEGNHE